MKEKRRYILYRIESAKKLGENEAKTLLNDAIMHLYGENGISKANAHVKFFNENEQLMLVLCSLGMQEEVIAALALKLEFQNEKIALRLQKIYGTVKNAEKFFPDARKKLKERKMRKDNGRWNKA